jgi:hypothetical protein
MTLWQRAVALWKRLRRARRLTGVVSVETMSQVPVHLDGALYVVGAPMPKWAIMRCPCGCGERLDINLMGSRRPTWRIRVGNGRVTLSPSIWVPEDRCGSHFWIRGNRIQWV